MSIVGKGRRARMADRTKEGWENLHSIVNLIERCETSVSGAKPRGTRGTKRSGGESRVEAMVGDGDGGVVNWGVSLMRPRLTEWNDRLRKREVVLTHAALTSPSIGLDTWNPTAEGVLTMAAEWVGVRIGNGWRREEEAAGMRAKQVLRQVEGGSGSAVRYRSRTHLGQKRGGGSCWSLLSLLLAGRG